MGKLGYYCSTLDTMTHPTPFIILVLIDCNLYFQATILSAVVASAAAAPSGIANDPLWNAGALPAGVVAGAVAPAAIGYAGIAAAPAVVAAAPVAPIHEHGPVSVPAPYSTSVQAPATSSVHQPPQQVSKQVHYGTQTYVAGYNTQVLKPVIPKINIAVPTALKGTQSVTAPIVNTAVENYVVNEPVHVEKPYAVPYDVVKHAEQVVQVPSADETGTTLEEILAIARSQQPDECDCAAVCVDDDSADSEGINYFIFYKVLDKYYLLCQGPMGPSSQTS